MYLPLKVVVWGIHPKELKEKVKAKYGGPKVLFVSDSGISFLQTSKCYFQLIYHM